MSLPLSFRARLRLKRRFRRRSTVTAKRGALIGTGCMMMVAGVLSVPTPLPIGFVFFVLGLYFVAKGSKSAGRGITWLRRRLPAFSRGLNRVKPGFPVSVRRFIERSDPGEL